MAEGQIISAGHTSTPTTVFIAVLQGTWWVGTGPKFDPEKGTTPMPAGSFVDAFSANKCIGMAPRTKTPFC